MKIESRIDGLRNLVKLADNEVKKMNSELHGKRVHVHYETSFNVVDYYGVIDCVFEHYGDLLFSVYNNKLSQSVSVDSTMFTFVEDSDGNQP